MILSGEKKEEYREIKSYWIVRLLNEPFGIMSHTINQVKKDVECCPNGVWKQFDTIIFKNGYSKNARTMQVEFLGIEIGKPYPLWCANWKNEEVFKIKLGKLITP